MGFSKKEEEDLEALYGDGTPLKKIRVGRRILTELVDFSLVVGVYCLLFYLVGNFVIPSIAQNSITNINEIFQEKSESRGYGELTKPSSSNYGFVDLDEVLFTTYYQDKNPGASDEECFQKYIETRESIYKAVIEDDNYTSNMAGFNLTYISTYAVSLFIPILIFQLVIPLFNKNGRTIGMIITKTSMVNLMNNERPPKYKLLIRFFVIFLIEFLLVKYVFSDFIFLILPLIYLATLFPTKSRLVSHDFLSATKIIESKYVGLIEEVPSKENEQTGKKQAK